MGGELITIESMTMEIANATLYIVATPIGNLEDISYRAIQVLSSVDALASEDTRHTRKIFSRYEIPTPRTSFSYHEHNEQQAGRKILNLLETGRSVALCTDAGMPGISDPGYRIVSSALEKGHKVDVLPGPSAVTSALVASGLPTSSFTFKGFPSRKPGQRKKFLEMEKDMPHTLVLFEAPSRIDKLLADALETLGNRAAAVCIDMTKLYEDVKRGYLKELHHQFVDKKTKGEITVVIAGNHPKFLKEQE